MDELKDYLKNNANIDKLIKIKQAELGSLDSLKNIMIRLNSTYQHDRNTNIDITVSRINELEDFISTSIYNLALNKKRIIEALSKLSNEEYKYVLYARYIKGKTWQSIAHEMKCSFQWVHKLHNKALSQLSNANIC